MDIEAKARIITGNICDMNNSARQHYIAQALRSAQADAFEEAAKVAMIEPCEGHHHGHKCAEYIAEELRDRAAALRSGAAKEGEGPRYTTEQQIRNEQREDGK